MLLELPLGLLPELALKLELAVGPGLAVELGTAVNLELAAFAIVLAAVPRA